MELKDKVVIITGGSKGFGKALTEVFQSEGANVVINSHNKEEIVQVADAVRVFGIYGDVTKEDDMENLASETIKKFGKIDIWVNNAGIYRERKKAEDFDMNKVREMFDVNVFGLMNSSRVALRYMKKKNAGILINIISTAALSGRSEISTYTSSKWAANGFTKSIREENRDSNISILSVFPGGMKTDLFGEGKLDDFDNYMNTKDVAQKVIDNLKNESPKPELIIKRPNV